MWKAIDGGGDGSGGGGDDDDKVDELKTMQLLKLQVCHVLHPVILAMQVSGRRIKALEILGQCSFYPWSWTHLLALSMSLFIGLNSGPPHRAIVIPSTIKGIGQ